MVRCYASAHESYVHEALSLHARNFIVYGCSDIGYKDIAGRTITVSRQERWGMRYLDATLNPSISISLLSFRAPVFYLGDSGCQAGDRRCWFDVVIKRRTISISTKRLQYTLSIRIGKKRFLWNNTKDGYKGRIWTTGKISQGVNKMRAWWRVWTRLSHQNVSHRWSAIG